MIQYRIKKNLITGCVGLLCVLLDVGLYAQSRLHYTPEKPQAGDIIHIEYTPNESNNQDLTAFALIGTEGNRLIDLKLKKVMDYYVADVPTDTADVAIAFGFFNGVMLDNNENIGYYLNLYKGEKEKRGAHAKLAEWYGPMGIVRFGFPQDDYPKIADHLQQEMNLYPSDSLKYLTDYYAAWKRINKDSTTKIVNEQLETFFDKGISTEEEYTVAAQLSSLIGRKKQAKFLNRLKYEKFPNSKKPDVNEYFGWFLQETSPEKKEEVIHATEKAGLRNPEDSRFASYALHFKEKTAEAYALKGNWAKFEELSKGLENQRKYNTYNATAFALLLQETDIEKALSLSQQALTYVEKELKKPTEEPAPMSTAKEWYDIRQNRVYEFQNTYARLLVKSGNAKRALPIAQKLAQEIGKNKNPEYNTAYALAVAAVYPANKAKAIIEPFVRNNAYTTTISEVLKSIYDKEHGSEKGFATYFSKLENASNEVLIAELRKQMLGTEAPNFTLKDLKGNTIKLSELKGKTIILDFWATWCGPCKASFPALQEVINKYASDPNIVFLFIDTWERSDNKETAAAEFIKAKNYTFQVLMDNDNKVVSDYKISAIPTKFIIDKEGLIQFKTTTYDGHDELIKQLSAMIEMVK